MSELLSQPAQIEGVASRPNLVEALPALPEDEIVRRRAARFIGAVALESEVEAHEFVSTVNPIESLYDAVLQAAEGSEDAWRMVRTNVRTDVVERTIKTGHVTEVDLCVDEAGKIQQFGQSMESIQANSLRYASGSWQMRERIEAETLNSFRIEQMHRQGKLEDYNFVVFSRAADNMSHQEMQDIGFFTETMSCSIQVTSSQEGRLVTESAFVAGVNKVGGERFDDKSVAAVGQELGVDLSNKSACEVLATPIMVHKSLMPNGVVDLVKMYDEASEETFFGEKRKPQDYVEYKAQCQKREANFSSAVEKISQELVSQASALGSKMEAVELLDKLSGEHMASKAATDPTIDSRVFGRVAQMHIENARLQIEAGNYEQAELHITKAQETQQSHSCPSSKSLAIGSSEKLSTSGEDQYGSLTFKCQKGHLNTRPKGKLIPNCKVCGVSVKC